MSLYNYKLQVDMITHLLKKKTSHHYLLKHVESPYIDLDRILMMTVALNEQKIPSENSQKYITSAMLVQIALDTHDKVSNKKIALTERQLTVLAGDLFSGMYYHLLANEENIELIRALAHAIKIINEDKIFIYRLEAEELYTFLERMQRVESTVIEQFCLHFNSATYNKLFKEFLFLKRLLKEWEEYKRGSKPILLAGITKYCLSQVNSNEPLHFSNADQQKLESVWGTLLENSQNNLIETASRFSDLPEILWSRIMELSNRFKNIAT